MAAGLLTYRTADHEIQPSPALRAYRKPPVHEVVFSIALAPAASESAVRDLGRSLASKFPHVGEQRTGALEVEVAGAEKRVRTSNDFDGWIFLDAKPPHRVLRTSLDSLSYHVVRPGSWPSGEYPGWEQICPELEELLNRKDLRKVYGRSQIERVGLRYLNRMAVPEGSALSDWVKYRLDVPSILQRSWSFNVRETWAEIADRPYMSATVGIAKIQIPDERFKAGNYGFLLDIEVFNLWKPRAPKYEQLVEWANEAHGIENQIFEEMITDQLRNRFEEIA